MANGSQHGGNDHGSKQGGQTAKPAQEVKGK